MEAATSPAVKTDEVFIIRGESRRRRSLSSFTFITRKREKKKQKTLCFADGDVLVRLLVSFGGFSGFYIEAKPKSGENEKRVEMCVCVCVCSGCVCVEVCV